MRKCSIAESVWTTSAGLRQSRMQPASVSARPSRCSALRNRTRPPSKSAVTFLRRTAGRSNGRRASSVMMGVALSLLGKKSGLATNFYPVTAICAMSASTTSTRFEAGLGQSRAVLTVSTWLLREKSAHVNVGETPDGLIVKNARRLPLLACPHRFDHRGCHDKPPLNGSQRVGTSTFNARPAFS